MLAIGARVCLRARVCVSNRWSLFVFVSACLASFLQYQFLQTPPPGGQPGNVWANIKKYMSDEGHSRCIACENRASTEPLSPAQSCPMTRHLTRAALSDDKLGLITNNENVVGEAFLEITDQPIQVSDLTERYAACDRCGAIATFLGVTRNHYQGREVVKLSYEAFSSMAVKQMQHIVGSVFQQFPQVHRVVISHRIGVVPVKEASVFIAVTTEHRQSGLQAVAFAIDVLKAKVPVWKREYYASDKANDDGPKCDQVDDGERVQQSTERRNEDACWKRNPEFTSAR